MFSRASYVPQGQRLTLPLPPQGALVAGKLIKVVRSICSDLLKDPMGEAMAARLSGFDLALGAACASIARLAGGQGAGWYRDKLAGVY